MSSQSPDLQQQATTRLKQGKYDEAIGLYEQAIEADPNVMSNYWYLGLALLLQGQEEDAQAAWMMAMMQGDPEQIEPWTIELTEILQAEAKRQESRQNDRMAWVIRQHTRELDPENLANLLESIRLSAQLELLEENDETIAQVLAILQASQGDRDTERLLLQILPKLWKLQPAHPGIIQLTEASVKFSESPDAIAPQLFQAIASWINQKQLPPRLLLHYVELGTQFQPPKWLLVEQINLYQTIDRYADSVQVAEAFLQQADTLLDRIAAHYLLIKGLLQTGGQFNRAREVHQQLLELLEQLMQSPDIQLDENHILNLITTVSNFAYFDDRPEFAHNFRTRFAQFWQATVREHFNIRTTKVPSRSQLTQNRPLRIGYISACLRRHSIGSLVQWLLLHHDRENFKIYAYSLKQTDDRLQQTIRDRVSEFRNLSRAKSVVEIYQTIRKDNIDILVDLDSLTSSTACAVMALKPAPIQVTWLGYDSSQLPAIDYFIADPYVLPEAAQDYYTPKIWRLSETLIAVDGFELDVPELKRDRLGIPKDAIVYFSSQTGYKRNPDNARSQLKIIKEVPNSYFLVKSLIGDAEAIRNFFETLADEEGVERDRIRILPPAASEAIHRANLDIADVVLDTYPYNGATTTLETLWMGIPIVTRVGEQFAARNSYTMLKNAGIDEGIAHTEAEYIEWGIRFGTDSELRQTVFTKLQESRKTSPLWNTQKFARDIESAYAQMWDDYRSQIDLDALSLEPINLHIGGKEPHPDWKILDVEERPEVDFICDAANLDQFDNNSVDSIYASHVLEHFHHSLNNEVLNTLTEWHRVLKPGGKLYISVPDMQTLCWMYCDPTLSPSERLHLVRIIFGAHTNQFDVHKAGFDFDVLGMYIRAAGFEGYERISEFRMFRDCSIIRLKDTLISLNVIATKGKS